MKTNTQTEGRKHRYNWTVRDEYGHKLMGLELKMKTGIDSGSVAKRVTKQKILEAMIEVASEHEPTRTRIIKAMSKIV